MDSIPILPVAACIAGSALSEARTCPKIQAMEWIVSLPSVLGVPAGDRSLDRSARPLGGEMVLSSVGDTS